MTPRDSEPFLSPEKVLMRSGVHGQRPTSESELGSGDSVLGRGPVLNTQKSRCVEDGGKDALTECVAGQPYTPKPVCHREMRVVRATRRIT